MGLTIGPAKLLERKWRGLLGEELPRVALYCRIPRALELSVCQMEFTTQGEFNWAVWNREAGLRHRSMPPPCHSSMTC